MDSSALVIVDEAGPDRIVGRLVEVERDFVSGQDEPGRDFLTVDIRFAMPEKSSSRGWREQLDLDSGAEARRAAFEAVCAGVGPSSMLRLEYARGAFDPRTGEGYLAAAGAVLAGGPAETAALLTAPRVLPPVDPEHMVWRTVWDIEFYRRAAALADPAWDPQGGRPPRVIGIGSYEGEVAADEARHQPDEALVLVLGGDEAQVLDHHGAYMFFSDGSDARDVGMNGLPEEPGIYYVRGEPWGYGPDINGEYDSGFDVKSSVLAGPEHYRLFGSTPEDYAEDVEIYRSEHGDVRDQAPSPAV